MSNLRIAEELNQISFCRTDLYLNFTPFTAPKPCGSRPEFSALLR